ncbi:hypothetical protein AB0M48_38790 [Lentzea sp. NPDC051208]|uniref:hypothetical protein n=1 Tax=Lentzea sp. NPDC051208 TaxID=3154642 RepID=UPI00341EBD91
MDDNTVPLAEERAMADPNEFVPIDLALYPHVAECRTSTLAAVSYNATARRRASTPTRFARIESLRAIHRSCTCIVAACDTALAFTPVLNRWARHMARELQSAIAAMETSTGLSGDLVPVVREPAEDLFTSAVQLRHLIPAEASAVHGVIDHLLEVDSTAASLTAMWNSGFAGRPMPPAPNFGHIRDCFAFARDVVSSTGPSWQRQIAATADEALELIDLACELMTREHLAGRAQRRNDGR